jgi:hypothetical protein
MSELGTPLTIVIISAPKGKIFRFYDIKFHYYDFLTKI